ncbi:P-loop containing nucleoside triphosphate hydrolase protein [Backusella circina FSU 941]|nr:P-loop containing nucleoside triphosphate hydrolase protein [Backusella circina FSU 941]
MSSSMDVDSSQSNNNAENYILPWVEKYRPVYLKDITGNEEAVERMEKIVQTGNLPNLILTGLPGIGKTTSILCLARELLGNSCKEGVLELNASDDRGIDVVRNKIKAFAQKKVTLPPGKHKIIILDEADSMTSGAQQALRRTMEIFSNTTRFALACNQINKIIEPIHSRCAILRYVKLSDDEVEKRLKEICEMENVSIDASGYDALIYSANGDMRQAVNNLQSCHYGFGQVNAENVWKICDQPHPYAIQKILSYCAKGDIAEAEKSMRELYDIGYSSLDIITTTFRVTKSYSELDQDLRLEYLRQIGFVHVRILEGHQSSLQLVGLVAKLCKASC